MTATAVETTTVRRPWMPPGVLVAAVGGPVLLAVTNALVDYMHLSGTSGPPPTSWPRPPGSPCSIRSRAAPGCSRHC